MIIYNITIKIDLIVHNEWLQWMKETHIPDVMATGYFSKHRMMRLLEDDQRDGFTYAVQYETDGMSKLLEYQEKHAPALQKDHATRFEGKFVAFRSLMREV